jgi:3-oxoacyl-[acyl-carrier-protein] synthase-3
VTTAIIGTGSDLPAVVLTNDALAATVDDFDADRAGLSLDEWVGGRVGIRSRHRLPPGEGTAAMAVRAGRRALAMAGIEAAALDLIVLSTFTSDHRLPQSVSVVQAELGSTAKCLQLETACTGFVDGMLVAGALLDARSYETALVVHSEAMSAVIDPSQFLLNAIFGDGAGAAVVRRDPTGRTGVQSHVTGTDGTKAFWLEAGTGTLSPASADGAHFMRFDYKRIFDFAVDRMVESCLTAVIDGGSTIDDIDYVVAHQTGINIITAVADRLGIAREKFLLTLDHTGNTSGATIPIALDEFNRRGILQPGHRVLLPAVGAGMAWGALYLVWSRCGPNPFTEEATAIDLTDATRNNDRQDAIATDVWSPDQTRRSTPKEVPVP